MAQKQKLTIYLDAKTVAAIHAEARRLERSTSYLLGAAWKISAATLAAVEPVPEVLAKAEEGKR